MTMIEETVCLVRVQQYRRVREAVPVRGGVKTTITRPDEPSPLLLPPPFFRDIEPLKGR